MNRKLNRKGGKQKKYDFSSSYDDAYFKYDDDIQFQVDDVYESSLSIEPKNEKQEEYVKLLHNVNHKLLFATGPAGTGKTLLACTAAISGLVDGHYDKIVITRPAVNVEENLGFLPGDISEKMDPYLKPIFDVFQECYSQSHINYMMKEKIIEICPLAFMRGRTFRNSFIIADEMQNSSVSQMKMILTRLGFGSKMVVTGDLNQHDRKYVDNGLKDILKKIENKNYKRIRTIEFGTNDIERSQIVKDIIEIYECSSSSVPSSEGSAEPFSESISSNS
jgi:phosphate starvation-inducible PhoH-like protein